MEIKEKQNLGSIICKMCKKRCIKHGTRQLVCENCKPKYDKIKDEERTEAKRKHKKETPEVFPRIYCTNCGQLIQLDFHPLKEFLKLKKMICPKCNKRVI